ncbi:MAG: class I SAM-dependent methyltransferase [Phycisphaerales bacterium]|nr:MAG: class I SAM-dependent methyltransferase [Phycisphaerales bacterium]
MTEKKGQPWHEQDGFWDTFAPVIFDRQRRDLAAEEIDRLIELLGLAPGQYICDLCCGVGRHSLELARRGFAITAVDRTEQYLDQARDAARAEGLEIQFVHADMRDFCQPESFDVVLNLFTSFGYFDAQRDDCRVVENARRCLKEDGRFVLDLMSKEIIARVFRARDWRPVEGGIMLEDRKIVDGWTRIENCWTLIREDRQHQWTFSHRLYSGAELCRLLQDCRFRETRVYGGLDGSPYDDKAERLVVVARK